MPQEKQPEDFQVVDRRRFSDTGERRADVSEEPPKPSAPAPLPPRTETKTAKSPPPPRQEAPKPPPPRQPSDAAQQVANSYEASGIGMRKAGFDRVVITFAQTAMLQLGLLAADPAQPLEPDLFGARETIDALAVIEEKTRGNLTPQEQQMLENTLFELRMAWMEVDRRYLQAKPK